MFLEKGLVEMVMVIKEEDYKRSFSIIVLITKDFSEVVDYTTDLDVRLAW